MLTSLVLTLTSPAQAALPQNLGRASHALFLRLAREYSPDLSTQLHDAEGVKPFTCSNLVGGRRQGTSRLIAPDDRLWLRWTGLDDAVSQVLDGVEDKPPAEVELDGIRFRVADATTDAGRHPWAGRATYADLVQRHLMQKGHPSRRITLGFVSPTTFRSGGLNLPLPIPALVFGGLLERWGAFAPTRLSPDARRYAEEMVALSRYSLRTRVLPFKEGALQVGFVGEATFLAMNDDRYWVGVLNLLADYAFFAGIGYQTTVGMGQARRGEGAGA